MFKLKNMSFILIVFFAISCDDDMKDFKYRNSNYAYFISTSGRGEWRLIEENIKNDYIKGDQIYYFFDNGDKYGKIEIIDKYENRIVYFYNNDTITERIKYKNNEPFETYKKDGFHIEYKSNKGQILSKGYIKDNKEDGLWEDFYEDGNLKRKMNFKNGLRHGNFIEYFDNSDISLIGKYWHNQKIDTLKWFYKDGTIKIKEVYIVDTINKKCVGYVNHFFENGKIHKIVPILDWKREGIAKLYYENGNLKFLTEYKNDVIEGIVKGYHENGKLYYSGKVKDNIKEKVFEFEYYDEEGNLVKTE